MSYLFLSCTEALYIRKYYDHGRLLEIDAAVYISATILH